MGTVTSVMWVKLSDTHQCGLKLVLQYGLRGKIRYCFSWVSTLLSDKCLLNQYVGSVAVQ